MEKKLYKKTYKRNIKLYQQKHTHALRLGIVFSSTDKEAAKETRFITQAIYTALTTLSNGLARNYITKLVKEENVAELQAKKKSLADLEVNVSCSTKVFIVGELFSC